MLDLKDKMTGLKELRDKANAKKALIDNVFLQFETKMKDDIESLGAINRQIEIEETIIREAVIEGYRLDMEKHREYGIEVKTVKSIKYAEDLALKFAKQHGLFLKLDNKAFEKFAKENYAKEDEIKRFVDLLEEPKVFLPSVIKVE